MWYRGSNVHIPMQMNIKDPADVKVINEREPRPAVGLSLKNNPSYV